MGNLLNRPQNSKKDENIKASKGIYKKYSKHSGQLENLK